MIGCDNRIRKRAHCFFFLAVTISMKRYWKKLPSYMDCRYVKRVDRDLKIVWKRQHDCSRSKMEVKFMKISTGESMKRFHDEIFMNSSPRQNVYIVLRQMI